MRMLVAQPGRAQPARSLEGLNLAYATVDSSARLLTVRLGGSAQGFNSNSSIDNPATAPGPPFGGKRPYAIAYHTATHDGTSVLDDRDDS